MPKRIGKYEITAEIGRGGFSRVYRGFDPNVNRPIAIKVSTRESDPEHLSRFRNEASAAGNLRHENIVTVYDYGDDDGVPYLVMELLDGRDLHHIMRDGPKMSLLEKMQVMSQVGEGLRCAHANGVVHRDIKPANVMVLSDGAVKILDFGIARMTGEVSRLTQSGYLVGTPLYMSPEQLQGGDADALCDVWAYGVLYFELLTGQHPFLSQDNTRLIRNIQIVNPPSVHSLTRGIPEGLAQVIRRALTKDRRRRYQNIEEVLVDTNPILALLQREQTSGLVSEAQFYRNSGQLAAARQTSRRALEIDPTNFGAQQLLKSIQHEMQAESLAAPEEVVHAPFAAAAGAAPAFAEPRLEPAVPAVPVIPSVPPPPPAPLRSAPPVVEEDLPEMILPDHNPAPAVPVPPVVVAPPPLPPLTTTPAPIPVFVPPPAPPTPVPVRAIPAPPTPGPISFSNIAPAAAALLRSSPHPNGPETPSPSTTQRFRPTMATGGAAAAIAAAVAAAKARQAEEEKQHKETRAEEEPALPAIKATPLVVSALSTSRVAPAPQLTASLKRAENGSGMFLTDDPLVVKRPATAVMTQRMKSADSTAAVATPPPAPPPTRLPGTKAIPSSISRSSNGSAEVAPAPIETRRPAENLPMRRPPSEVYSKGKRKNSGSLFQERKEKKSFPWAAVGFFLVVALAAAALILFAFSAPKGPVGPVLSPEKLTFSWKQGTPKPKSQMLRLKGGPNSASFSASSSDDEWLSVTPVSDEPTNRTWEIRIDPEKVSLPTGPNGTSGWIDVVSNEGFKTEEEVIIKVTPADPGASKNRKMAAPAALTPATPAPSVPATATKKPSAASAPPATSTKPAGAASAKPATATSTATSTKTPMTPAAKKPPVAEATDIN